MRAIAFSPYSATSPFARTMQRQADYEKTTAEVYIDVAVRALTGDSSLITLAAGRNHLFSPAWTCTRNRVRTIGYSPPSAFISLLALNASSTTASCSSVVNFSSTSPTFRAFTSSSAAQT
jgi:hypothetical protein